LYFIIGVREKEEEEREESEERGEGGEEAKSFRLPAWDRHQNLLEPMKKNEEGERDPKGEKKG